MCYVCVNIHHIYVYIIQICKLFECVLLCLKRTHTDTRTSTRTHTLTHTYTHTHTHLMQPDGGQDVEDLNKNGTKRQNATNNKHAYWRHVYRLPLSHVKKFRRYQEYLKRSLRKWRKPHTSSGMWRQKKDLEYVKRSLHKSPVPHSSAYLLGNVARDRVNADGVLYGLDAEAEECADEHKRH